jgi:hypothetical protein
VKERGASICYDPLAVVDLVLDSVFDKYNSSEGA